MILKITGNCKINTYYVQTLCMIFFPETKFAEDEEMTDVTPVLELDVNEMAESVKVKAQVSVGEDFCWHEETVAFDKDHDRERTVKIAIGGAVIKAAGALLNYQPAWGILIGVRPAKVASELLSKLGSRDEVVRTLVKDYYMVAKKAALATDVALTEAALIKQPSIKDCSIYVHIPFCPHRCAYCSFVAYPSTKFLSLIPDYLLKLVDEIEDISRTVKKYGLNVRTIYIGGGTPTILTAQQLNFLLGKIDSCFDVGAVEEYTIESGRPDTITAEKLAVAKAHGVTRISVNPQSLYDSVLKRIGRNHTVKDFYEAYDIAVASGIKYINTDIIAGLPGDSFPMFAKTVDKLIALRPHNITVHTFSVKKSADILKNGTSIYSVHGGDVGKCVDYSQIKVAKAGYIPYYMYRQKKTVGNMENVGFSLPGCECLYNVYMMEEIHSIFAAGAGAVSKLVDYRPTLESGDKTFIQRYCNHKYPYEYLSGGPVNNSSGASVVNATLANQALIDEFFRSRL